MFGKGSDEEEGTASREKPRYALVNEKGNENVLLLKLVLQKTF